MVAMILARRGKCIIEKGGLQMKSAFYFDLFTSSAGEREVSVAEFWSNRPLLMFEHLIRK